MEHDNDSVNRSGNRPFEAIANEVTSRRNVVAGGLTMAAGFVASPLAHAARGGKKSPHGPVGQDSKNGLIDFSPVPVAQGGGPLPGISPDYEFQVLLPWGQALNSNAPDYVGTGPRPGPADQANQVGIGHDGMWFYPFGNSSLGGVLALNNEFGENAHVLGKDDPTSLDDVRVSQYAHGVTIAEIRKNGSAWELVRNSPYNRRIHVNTPVTFSGPVAGSSLIDAGRGNFMGTINNCAAGPTLWGTYLTCEENFNGYFGSSVFGREGDNGNFNKWLDDLLANPATPRDDRLRIEGLKRYGFDRDGFNDYWHEFDPRFDLSDPSFSKEPHRFGWCVEIDPMAPTAVPVKRTALGRLKHENACMVEGRGGRAVVYMGDDERFDYIYRFVSSGNWRSMRARGASPLDHGTLYAAVFRRDGSGEWLELSPANPAVGAALSTLEEVLTYTRLAADAAGATPMDRPEWITAAPNGDLYIALTNNSNRTAPDPANPRVNNQDRHIVRWRDSAQHTGTSFEWELFVYAEDTHGAGDERTFSDPDGLWADPDGRLFIQTDGGQQKGLNDLLLVCSTYDAPDSPANPLPIARLLSGVNSCEITGIAVTPDRRTMFVNVQHPGNGDPAETNFPVMNAVPDGTTIPRDATIVISRRDGGIVGS